MRSGPEPSSDRFVVSGADAGAVGALAEVARVLPVDLPERPGAVLVELVPAPGSAKDRWQTLRDHLPSTVQADPVLQSGEGHVSYPTGTIALRLLPGVPEEAAADLAERLGLEVVRRKADLPQFVLARTPTTDGWLPEVVAELERDPRVRRAWAETRSEYRRA